MRSVLALALCGLGTAGVIFAGVLARINMAEIETRMKTLGGGLLVISPNKVPPCPGRARQLEHFISLSPEDGATPIDIALQFFLEGAVLATLGVLAGLGLGLTAQIAAARWFSAPQGLDATLPVIAASVSLGVSAMACSAPALRAARLEPAIALRP